MSLLGSGGFAQVGREIGAANERVARRNQGSTGVGGFLGDVGKIALAGALQKGVTQVFDATGDFVNKTFQEDFNNWFEEDEKLIKLRRQSSNAENAIARARKVKEAADARGISMQEYLMDVSKPSARAELDRDMIAAGMRPDSVPEQHKDSISYDGRLERSNSLADTYSQLLEYDKTALTTKERIEQWNEEFNPRSSTAVEKGLKFLTSPFSKKTLDDKKAIERMFETNKDGTYKDTKLQNVASINLLAKDLEEGLVDRTVIQDKLHEINQSDELKKLYFGKDYLNITKSTQFYRTGQDGAIILSEKNEIYDPIARKYTTTIKDIDTTDAVSDRMLLKDMPTISASIKNLFGVTDSRQQALVRDELFKTHKFLQDIGEGVFVGSPKTLLTFKEYNTVLKSIDRIVKENNLQVNWSDERSKLVETFTSNVLKNEKLSDAYLKMYASPPTDPISGKAYPVDSDQYQEYLRDRADANKIMSGSMNLLLESSKAMVGVQTGMVTIDYSTAAPIIAPKGHRFVKYDSRGIPLFQPMVIDGRARYSEEQLAQFRIDYELFNKNYHSNVSPKDLKSEASFKINQGIATGSDDFPTLGENAAPQLKTEGEKFADLLRKYDGVRAKVIEEYPDTASYMKARRAYDAMIKNTSENSLLRKPN